MSISLSFFDAVLSAVAFNAASVISDYAPNGAAPWASTGIHLIAVAAFVGSLVFLGIPLGDLHGLLAKIAAHFGMAFIAIQYFVNAGNAIPATPFDRPSIVMLLIAFEFITLVFACARGLNKALDSLIAVGALATICYTATSPAAYSGPGFILVAAVVGTSKRKTTMGIVNMNLFHVLLTLGIASIACDLTNGRYCEEFSSNAKMTYARAMHLVKDLARSV